MARLKDDLMVYLGQDEIAQLVANIARQIESDHMGKEVVLICPLRGSLLFASDLARELKLWTQIDFVYLKALSKKGTIYFEKDISLDLRGKSVVICEEIIDAGRKLDFLINRVLQAGPDSVRVAALLDKPARRELPISPDYVGKTIDDRFVVGYGMDADEHGRNYPDICIPRN